MDPSKTPAPKNFWPYSYQFYMCNPIQTFQCTIRQANTLPKISFDHYVQPDKDRSRLPSPEMPFALLSKSEKEQLGLTGGKLKGKGITEEQRNLLQLRDTDKATPQHKKYERGVRRG